MRFEPLRDHPITTKFTTTQRENRVISLHRFQEHRILSPRRNPWMEQVSLRGSFKLAMVQYIKAIPSNANKI